MARLEPHAPIASPPGAITKTIQQVQHEPRMPMMHLVRAAAFPAPSISILPLPMLPPRPGPAIVAGTTTYCRKRMSAAAAPRPRAGLLLLVVLLFFPPAAGQNAGATPAPERLQAEVMLKLFSRNYRFDASGADTLVVPVVYEAASASEAARLRGFLAAFPPRTSGGRAIAFPLMSITALDSLVAGTVHGVVAVLAEGSAPAALAERCRGAGLLSITANPTQTRSGLAIGVGPGRDGSPEIWFNAGALKAVGAFYDTDILQLVHTWIW